MVPCAVVENWLNLVKIQEMSVCLTLESCVVLPLRRCVLIFLSSSCSPDWTLWCCHCRLQSRADELHTGVNINEHRWEKITIKTQMLRSTPGWVSSSRPEGLFLLPALFLYELGALLICERCPLSAVGSVIQNRASGPEVLPAAAAVQNQDWSGTFGWGRDGWRLRPEAWW